MRLQISRILHAGYVFEYGDEKIMFDPIFENPFSVNCHAYPNVEFDKDQISQLNFSAVFISHYHDDHCSLASLNLLDRETPIYMYCLFDEIFSMFRELGFTKVYSLKLDETVKLKKFDVTAIRALDEDVDSIFHIQAGGLHILNVVDSWIEDSSLIKLAQTKWDMVLWPFQTMREIEVLAPSLASPPENQLPAEWISQLQILKPRYVVPSSCQFIQEEWSWYRHAYFPISYRQFRSEIENKIPELKVVRLNPSASVFLDQTTVKEGPSLKWIRPIGNQDVDYEFAFDFSPSATSDISKHFAAITSEEAQRAYHFCQVELLQKYQSLHPPLDPYFNEPRLWRLTLFDHRGEPRHFFYTINQNRIEPSVNEQSPSWTTEVPLAKLYAAIELGETLASMYVRINDFTFEPEIAAEVRLADVLEDPLVKCLFNGSFGAYQKAQLKKLLS